ncbi:hypothetical protein HaLaN_09372 [Haematococcus lacustris]|uniref:Uncharacterized protein n=1 Tax=Haematococcus lacustris TaxID=44745 RepID=A0A699Z383_HAELA|nr:hypothetical protein HaLaN_09372 [Haematococcus lacustris]
MPAAPLATGSGAVCKGLSTARATATGRSRAAGAEVVVSAGFARSHPPIEALGRSPPSSTDALGSLVAAQGTSGALCRSFRARAGGGMLAGMQDLARLAEDCLSRAEADEVDLEDHLDFYSMSEGSSQGSVGWDPAMASASGGSTPLATGSGAVCKGLSTARATATGRSRAAGAEVVVSAGFARSHPPIEALGRSPPSSTDALGSLVAAQGTSGALCRSFRARAGGGMLAGMQDLARLAEDCLSRAEADEVDLEDHLDFYSMSEGSSQGLEDVSSLAPCVLDVRQLQPSLLLLFVGQFSGLNSAKGRELLEPWSKDEAGGLGGGHAELAAIHSPA